MQMSEQETAQLKDYILFLESEVAQLVAHNADLQQQIEMINEPTYD